VPFVCKEVRVTGAFVQERAEGDLASRFDVGLVILDIVNVSKAVGSEPGIAVVLVNDGGVAARRQCSRTLCKGWARECRLDVSHGLSGSKISCRGHQVDVCLERLWDRVLCGAYLLGSLGVGIGVELCSQEAVGLSYRSLQPYTVALDCVRADPGRTEPCLHGLLASVAWTE